MSPIASARPVHYTNKPFRRPAFQVSRDFPTDSVDATTILDLIHFNCQYNPDHLFALQEVGHQANLIHITFRDLRDATVACARLLAKSLNTTRPDNRAADSRRPVALFLESDVVVLVSVRLSPVAITHLLRACSAQAIVLSPGTQGVAGKAIEHVEQKLSLLIRTPYQTLMELARAEPIKDFTPPMSSSDQVGALILHSSGTTGLPKPILLANRYMLGYAACHQLQPEQCLNRLNVSTLPMYHGFGLLAPCLSLSTGKTCCFLPGNIIPSASSVSKLIDRCGASSLMTVPTILEDIASEERFLSSLLHLDFVAIGGGAIKPALGEQLVARGVKLLNHYGATEIGAIAPIFCPDDDYDWRYLRLRTDMDLEVCNIERQGEEEKIQCQLFGHPFGWDERFVVQDILESRPASQHLEVKILGRRDDMIVLSTGEKVLPHGLEETLTATGRVKTAIVFGQHRPEIGVIIEPVNTLSSDEEQPFLDSVWQDIQQENNHLDRHARVASRYMVILKPPHKTVPRSDKGSVMRKDAYEIFQEEIDTAYSCDSDSLGKGFTLSPESGQLEQDIRVLIQGCVQDRGSDVDTWRDDDDFFAKGMDSLEAARLARTLSTVRNKTSFPLLQGNIKALAIYQNSSIKALSRALRSGISGDELYDARHAEKLIIDLAAEFSPASTMSQSTPRKITVLLTGSTGNLGVHLLQQLCLNPDVQHIICLNRFIQGSMGQSSVEEELATRQMQANETREIALPEFGWSKITFLSSNHLDKKDLGLSVDEYNRLAGNVTHIIHNAWPMDFQRAILSFVPQIRAVRNLINFALDCHYTQKPSSPALNPRLLFLSSIAVAANYSPGPFVAEAPIDPTGPATFGYSQAKWVCERLLSDTMINHTNQIRTMVVRLGQLSGATTTGVWNANEHFPAILRASQMVGALPEMDGTFSWIPIDIASKSILEILFTGDTDSVFYQVENPIRQPWKPLLPVLTEKLNLNRAQPLAFDEWLEKALVAAGAARDQNFFMNLKPFLETYFRRLSSGEVIFDCTKSRKASRSLRACNGVGLDLLDRSIKYWRKSGFLQ